MNFPPVSTSPDLRDNARHCTTPPSPASPASPASHQDTPPFSSLHTPTPTDTFYSPSSSYPSSASPSTTISMGLALTCLAPKHLIFYYLSSSLGLALTCLAPRHLIFYYPSSSYGPSPHLPCTPAPYLILPFLWA